MIFKNKSILIGKWQYVLGGAEAICSYFFKSFECIFLRNEKKLKIQYQNINKYKYHLP